VTWWQASWRADPRGSAVADRHYNRQTPGAAQFVPPGSCCVFRHADDALWVTSWPFAEFVQHDWAGAWINSTFRNESERLTSELIVEAVAHTRAHYSTMPGLGMVTFVDADKVRPKRTPGYCYLMAGFEHVGFTKGGLWVYQMLPAAMPAAVPVDVAQPSLFEAVSA
jgi:hypothetical protein